MPSPLSGFTQAAASPMIAQLGPATPDTAPPIGSSADATARTRPSSRHSSRRCSAYSSISGRSAPGAGRFAVARVPTPRLTSPVPSGNTQP